MASASWYGVDSRKVAHETIDGEVIMIHLVQGNYFSLEGLGADLWELLVTGRGRDETLTVIGQRYEGEPALIAEVVDELVAELAKEALVEPCPDDGAPAALNGSSPPVERKPFSAPKLQKYTDMQDFLLVDPIHEVDETGWPPQQRIA